MPAALYTNSIFCVMKISVIIPVYNVALYVEECLQSVANQTFKDLEVLVVDDCGTDASMELVQHFIDNYTGEISFKVLHHEKNRGLSAARNTGMDVATGEYIAFIDSDDFFAPTYFEKLLNAFSFGENIGVSACGIENFCLGEISDFGHPCHETHFVEPGDYISSMLFMKMNHAMWGKLFKAEYLKNVRFQEGKNNEDILFALDFFPVVEANGLRLVEIPDRLYSYRVRQGSITTNEFGCFKFDELPNLKTAIDRCIKQKPEIVRDLQALYLRKVEGALTYLMESGTGYGGDLDRLRREFLFDKKYVGFKFVSNSKTFFQYFLILGLKYFPGISCHFSNKRNRKAAFAKDKHMENLFVKLGDGLMGTCIANAGCEELERVAVFKNRGLWLNEKPGVMHWACREQGLLSLVSDKAEESGKIRFAVYRDPFERLVSVYQEQVQGKKVLGYYSRLGCFKQMSFESFLKVVRQELSKANPLDMDEHLRPQSDCYRLDDVDCVVPYSLLKRFLLGKGVSCENLPEDLSASVDFKPFESFRAQVEVLYAKDYEILTCEKKWSSTIT